MTAITSNRRRTLQLGTALATCIACAGVAQVAVAQELPGNATVQNGGPAIVPTHSDSDASLRIDLRNSNAVINWDRFGIGKNQAVNFVSTGIGGTNTVTPLAVLNRVTGTDVSKIDGTLNAQNNIQVWLANPNGITFGNGGVFNGGSLILTTLVDNIETAFSRSTGLVPLPSRISGTAGGTITLAPGSTLTAGRDIVLVAQKISAGGSTSSGNDTAMIAAQDVTFASGLGSPLSYTVNKGTSLSGLRVLGSGDIEGQNVALVAGTVNAMVDHLLSVDEGAQLTATDNNGTVTLSAITTGGAAQSLTKPQIETQGVLKGGSSGDVIIDASGSAIIGGTITAGRDVALTAGNGGDIIVPAQVAAGRDFSASARNVGLGNGSATVLQAAGRNIDVVADDGAIRGEAGLTLRLNTTNPVGARRIVIDAGTGGTVAFAAGSQITAQGTAAGSPRAPVGIRFDSATDLTLGNVTASRLGNYTGSVQNDLTGAATLTAGTILTDATFNADFTGAIRLAGATASGNNADVILRSGDNLDTTGLVKATRDVDLTAGATNAAATATIAGAVDAGNDYSVTGGNVKLGAGTDAVQQVASDQVTITAGSGRQISGDAGLTLRANRDADNAGNRLILDASSSGTIAFALGSSIAAGSTADGATNAAIGVRFNRAAPGAPLALGDVVGLRLGDFSGGSTIDTALTGASDFTARNVTTNQAFNADFGGAIRIASLTTTGTNADVTLRAGSLVSGSQVTAPAISITSTRDVAVTAGADVTMARVRGRNLMAAAGADLAPAARQNGALTLLDGDMSGDVGLTAWGDGTGGQILVGKALAGGTLTLDNTAGTSGSIKVADSLKSAGLLTLRSARDILVSRYGGSGTVGTVTSTGGAIDAQAGGSVLAYDAMADAALAPFAIAQAGFGGISAGGNLTLNTAGAADVAVGSLSADDALTLNITGNLYGRSQTTTAVPGGFFKSQTTTSVAANTTNGTINLARIESGGTTSLTANKIAVGTLVSGSAATLTAPAAQTYVGLVRFTGDATLTVGSTFADIGTVTPDHFYADAVDLSAGTSLTGSVTGAAEIGTATAGGPLALQTGGVVAGTLTSTGGALRISASSGTLAVGTGSAATDIALTKQGGSVLVAGDDLRFTQLTGGTGGLDGQLGSVVLQSQTHVRGDRIDALGGDASIAAGYNGASGSTVQAGEITGLAGGTLRVTATKLSDVASGGRIIASSGALGDYGQLRADGDISIVAGTSTAGLGGALRVDDAQAGGNLYLANQNVAAGTPTGISFGSLRADGDVGLITSTGNGGDARGTLIDAGGKANLSVGNIQVDTISADRNVALMANNGRITNASDSAGIKLDAGGGIAADAGLTIRVDTANATSGDLALRASGLLTAGTLIAGDDVTLSGASVRLGSATSTGTGGNASDVSFTATTTVADPLRPGFSAQVPTVAGAQQPANLGGNVTVTATTGDVTGLALDPLVTPAVALVTTGDTLSSAYGAANLTAQGRSGSVTVSAANAAQLGAVSQGSAASGTGNGSVDIAAKAISAGSVTARTGSATLNAGAGTLVVGTVSAYDTASLVKAGASTTAGDEIRFNTVTGGAGETDPARLAAAGGENLGVTVQSATNVLGNTITANLGGVRVSADAGAIGGRTGGALSVQAGGAASLQNVTLRSATAIDLGNVVARDRLSVIAGASGGKAGRIAVVDARSNTGSIYLTAVNTVAGSASDIRYNTLAAPGEVVAITSGSNRGDVSRLATTSAAFAIDAGTDVSIDGRNLSLDNVRAAAGTVALNASGFIAAGTLQAGKSLAALAGGAIDVDTASAGAGDVAFQAGGLLTLANATASDDVLLTGSGVRVGTVTTLGGDEVTDTDFASLAAIRDPSADGVTALVPAGASASSVAGSSIVITATNGDVSGLAIDPLVTPVLGTVTTGAQLSTAYGKANLTANDGAVTVAALAGSAQLGTVSQLATGDGGTLSPFSDVTISARAISADTVTANTGSFGLDASLGTLVLGSGFSSNNATLTKRGGNASVDGDELRVLGIGVSAMGGITAVSDTHVRANNFGGMGTMTVRALGGDVSGLKTSTDALIPLPTVTTGAQLSSAYGRLGVQSLGAGQSVVVSASGAAQLGLLAQGSIGSGGPLTGAITVTASAISVDSAAAKQGALSLLASQGTLVLGSGSASTTIDLTKQGGNAGVDGDELRITDAAGLRAGSGITALSATHVRGTAFVTDAGNLAVRASGGDVTGIKIGSAATLPVPLVTTGSELSSTYGHLDLTGSADGATVSVQAQGAAQLGNVVQGTTTSFVGGMATGAIAVDAQAISADGIDANAGLVRLNAQGGTVVLGTVESGTQTSIVKSAGDVATAGDEVRFDRISGGTLGSTSGGSAFAGDVVIDSQTHVRGNRIDATGGSVVLHAGRNPAAQQITRAGEITGLGYTAAMPTALAATASGNANVAGAGNILIDSGARMQLGALRADGDIAAIAGGTTAPLDGAIRLDTAQSGGNLTLTTSNASGGTPSGISFAALTSGGNLALATSGGNGGGIAGTSLSAGGSMSLAATGGGVTISDSATAQGSALFGATGDVAIANGAATTGTLGILAGGNVSSTTSLTAGEDLAIQAGGTVQLAAAKAGDDLTVTAPGTIAVDSAVITGLGAGNTDVVFGTPPALSIGAATRPGNTLALTSTAGDVRLGTATIAGASPDGATTISAAGALALAGDLSVQGSLSILAGGDVVLGDAQARSQTATGALSITSTGGSIRQGAGRLTLGANSDGLGAEGLTLAAQGDVALANADLLGGTARQSAIGVNARAGSIALRTATGATFTANAGASFTAGGAITTGTAALGADSTVPTVSITAANGNLVATTIDAAEAGHDVLLRASNAITLDRVTAGRAVDASSGGALTANALTASGGALAVTSGAGIGVGSSTSGTRSSYRSGGDTTVGTLTAGAETSVTSGGAATLTQVQSGGAVDVASTTSLRSDKLASGGALTIAAGTDATLGALTSTGAATITADGAVQQLTSVDAGGALTVTAGTNATLGSLRAAGAAQLTAKAGALSLTDLNGGASANLVSTTTAAIGNVTAAGPVTVASGGATTGGALVSGGAVTMTSGNALTLGRLSAGGPTSVTTATAVRIDQLSSGAATTIKAGTDATLGATTSAGDATVTAKGVLTLNGAFNAGGRTVTFTARDAAISGDVTASTIRIVDDGAAGNALVLGDNATGNGFALSAAEVGHLKAATTLVFDAASAPVKQDVSIGSLALAASPKVLVLADGTRIDVTGKIDVSGTTTALQLGGSAENAGLASILRVVAKPDGTGGSIAAPGAAVTLRAVNIAFGQDAGFLSALGVTGSGTGDATTALTFNDKASSTLYFSGTGGGAPYTPSLAGVKLLTANTLTLSYTNFALFQNTGVQGQTSGVDIGTFLTVNATGTQPVLGLFGTLAGREGTAASLLGSLAFDINLNDIRSSRINGCVVGEGAGCITTVVFSPNLASIDAVRPLLFVVASDYEVPFNPLIGTNNDALFGDVGTFGLADIPLDPIECSDPANPQCPRGQQAPAQSQAAAPVAPAPVQKEAE